jgi:hypothetical protein
MEVLHSSGKCLVFANLDLITGICSKVVLEKVTPSTLREVEWSSGGVKFVGNYGELEGVSDHDVALSVVVSILIVREFEIQWFVEGSNNALGHQRQLGVVISDQAILSLNGMLHDVLISCCAILADGSFESGLPRFLSLRTKSIMVSRERLESTNNMPSCTKFRSCFTKEATDVCTSQRNSNNIVHHYTCN